MIIVNHDSGFVVMTVTPDDGATGTTIVLREKFSTDEIAATVAGVLATRLGLRRRGTAWVRANNSNRPKRKR